MAILNLNDCFPEAADGTRGPLPKQLEFLRLANDLSPESPKYIRYIGGVGSGKTLIGCIQILSWAVQYPGDWLVGRQFFPELRDTTLKTFLDICPKQLIVEYRVADAIVKIRSANGQISNILFRHLEEPDKHRSLNLNGFYLDESSQVTEAAFLLLQSRLRGKYVRKGILTTNSDGRTWGWRYFVQKSMFADPQAGTKYANIRAPSTENVHLPPDYVKDMLGSWSEDRIRREIYADEEIFEGAVYPEFRRDVHVVKPFAIPDTWTQFIGADHGYTNPTCFLWCAQDYDGNVYVHREYYEKERLIEDIAKDVGRLQGPKDILAHIDPSTKATRGQTGASDWATYLEFLPRNIGLLEAKNEVSTGIDRVKSYLRINETTKKPRLYIFDTCKNLLDELAEYRWEEQTAVQAERKNRKEAPRKYHDHACFIGSTLIETSVGGIPIKDVKPGDLVLTTLGYRRVLAAGMTGRRRTYAYSVGLTATPDHPILLANGTKKNIHDLTPYDTLVTVGVWKSSSMALFFGRSAGTIEQTVRTVGVVLNHCIERFGSYIMGLSQKGITYTTLTGIPITTTSPTSNASLARYICPRTRELRTPGPILHPVESTYLGSGLYPSSGIGALQVGNGTGNTLSKWLRRGVNFPRFRLFANFVRRFTLPRHLKWALPNSATPTAEPPRYAGVEEVYNLSVEGVSEYFANGVLVSNCDALRYAVMSRPEAPSKADLMKPKRDAPTLEGSIMRDWHRLKSPNPSKDPFGDY